MALNCTARDAVADFSCFIGGDAKWGTGLVGNVLNAALQVNVADIIARAYLPLNPQIAASDAPGVPIYRRDRIIRDYASSS